MATVVVTYWVPDQEPGERELLLSMDGDDDTVSDIAVECVPAHAEIEHIEVVGP